MIPIIFMSSDKKNYYLPWTLSVGFCNYYTTVSYWYWIQPGQREEEEQRRRYQTVTVTNGCLNSLNEDNQYSFEWESITGMRPCSLGIKAQLHALNLVLILKHKQRLQPSKVSRWGNVFFVVLCLSASVHQDSIYNVAGTSWYFKHKRWSYQCAARLQTDTTE